MEKVSGKRVFVGLSGGVDSAVSAALLQKAGAHVTGVFIKGWYPPGMPCPWAEDRRDAMRVAAHLGIPFRTLDASAEYKQAVIDYLLAEYRAGRTPNPDAMCNREVKFGAFYRYAKVLGADYIATGHYVSGEKDQRYFLWAVPKEALAETIFPLAGMEKSQVRALARRLALPVAEKPDSVGICFLGDVSVEDFLREQFVIRPGDAVSEDGERVGAHDGALLYTLGERVPVQGDAGPWYVVSKDIAQNRLTVARAPRALWASARDITFSSPNWIGDATRVRCAQYRYRGPFIAGMVEDGRFRSREPLTETPAPGQSLAFYDGAGSLAGGAVIG